VCRSAFQDKLDYEPGEEETGPRKFDWIECDTRDGVGHRAADSLDDDFVQVSEQNTQVWINGELGHLHRGVSERENTFRRCKCK
jgi:hypothetical protein